MPKRQEGPTDTFFSTRITTKHVWSVEKILTPWTFQVKWWHVIILLLHSTFWNTWTHHMNTWILREARPTEVWRFLVVQRPLWWSAPVKGCIWWSLKPHTVAVWKTKQAAVLESAQSIQLFLKIDGNLNASAEEACITSTLLWGT